MSLGLESQADFPTGGRSQFCLFPFPFPFLTPYFHSVPNLTHLLLQKTSPYFRVIHYPSDGDISLHHPGEVCSLLIAPSLFRVSQ